MRRPFAYVTTLALMLGIGAGQAVADAPKRVVSMNLCTDQLAMLLAGPGQLLSVSHLASDVRSSAMVEEAKKYEANHGLAEEIYLMQPDLVIAGAFSTRATVDMLRRLDIPVVVFEPAYSLDQVNERILQMGEALHQQDAAQAMVAEFDTKMAELQAEVSERPSAVLYYANGYTSGDTTLAGQILTAAGFENMAPDKARKLPLEVLTLTNPDWVITARPYPGNSRAEALLDHPVIQSLRQKRAAALLSDHDWVCGTPHVLRAIERLSTAREEMGEAAK